MSVGRSTTLVETEISQQLLDWIAMKVLLTLVSSLIFFD